MWSNQWVGRPRIGKRRPAAVVERNDATETQDTEINLLNTDEYGEATDRLEATLTGYEETRAGFDEAAGLVADLDDAGEAATICERAVEATRAQIEATEAADALVRAHLASSEPRAAVTAGPPMSLRLIFIV